MRTKNEILRSADMAGAKPDGGQMAISAGAFVLHIFGGCEQIARVSDTPNNVRETAPPPAEEHALTRAVIIAVAAASLAVAAFAATGQSYGIDEATSLVVAMARGPAEAVQYAQAVGASAVQAPLYLIYLYAWRAVAGPGEWAMRASNLPWFVLAQMAFLLLLRHRPKLALAACLLSALSPAVWLYLDETRPWIMQYAAACWLVAALAHSTFAADPRGSDREDRLAFLGAACAVVVLLGSGWASAVWATGMVAALAWLRFSAQPSAAGSPEGGSRPRFALAVVGALCVLLIIYQFAVWPGFGSGGAGLKQFVQGSIYVAYEFLGFSGFGPGKLELRLAPLASVARHLPAMLPLAACLALLGVFAVRHAAGRLRDTRAAAAWALALALPAGALFGAALVLGQRLAPRDFIPALPALVLALAAVVVAAAARKSLVLRGAAVAVPLLWLASGLNLRGQQAQAKEDYRTAAAMAAACLRDNKEVWWAADAATAFLYLTPVSMEQVPGRVWAMQTPDWNDIRFKLPPRVIVISRPDIFDAHGAVARYAGENHFVPALRLHGITIFTRENDRLPPLPPPPRR